MTTLFPPVLESRAVAIPFASATSGEEVRYYNISFLVPEIDGAVAEFATDAADIRHIQVTLRYKETGESAVNPNYSPDNATLFIPTYLSQYVSYNSETRLCIVKIPYYVFEGRQPKKATTYVTQVRFGSGLLWGNYGPDAEDPFPYSGVTDFSGFGTWRNNQTATVPSGFGEWSNIQTMYCYGDAKTSLTYNLNDFVPELVYTYSPEEVDPLEQCKIVYSYYELNGSVRKTIVVKGNRQSDGSYTARVKLPIAPVQVLYISLEAVTVNGTVRGRTLTIPPITATSGIPEDKRTTVMTEAPMRAEEKDDAVIAKRIVVPGGLSPESWPVYAIYRANVFTFETVKIKEGNLRDLAAIDIKDFSVEMGEDYQYIAIKRNNGVLTQLVPIFPWGFENSGYGRIMAFNSTFLDDKKHQLRIQGNVSVSSFKRNTADSFQTTIGSEYPFYSRGAETDYRSFQLSGVVTINCDPTNAFLKNDQVDGLRWEDDNTSKLLILNRDLYSDYEQSLSKVRVGTKSMTKHEIVSFGLEEPDMVRGPSSIYDSYYARENLSKIEPALSDNMVYLERKFRDCVMKWLSNGKPKLFRSETEGNMIVMPSAISFSPLDKTGRSVYSVSMTLTEIAEYNLDNLLEYDLLPIDITAHTIRNFVTELHVADGISKKDYLALAYLYPDKADVWFEPIDAEIYVVKDENGLQEALDEINESTFLRGSPQPPIYEKMVFINSDSFNIGHLPVNIAETETWYGPKFIDGVYYADGRTPNVIFTETTDLPEGFSFNRVIGQLYIEEGTVLEIPSPHPRKLTFSVSDGDTIEYFTVSIGRIYSELTATADPSSISAETTEDKITVQIEASGGIKFNELTDSSEDINYIYYAENLPYGLSMDSKGEITGRIIGKQAGGTITVTVTDATNNTKTVEIGYGNVYQLPYATVDEEIDLGYLEVGVPIQEVALRDYIAEGSGNFAFQIVSGAIAGLGINEGILSGRPTGEVEDSTTITIGVQDKGLDPELNEEEEFEPHTFLKFLVRRVLPTFVFENDYEDKLTTIPIAGTATDGSVNIGAVLKEINIPSLKIEDSENSLKCVRGGLPFERVKIDENGNEKIEYYYKYSAINLYPDYQLTIDGVLSGRAMVASEERRATLMAMDARGKTIKMNGEDGQTVIRPINSSLKLTEPIVLELPSSIAGSEGPLSTTLGKEYIVGGTSPYRSNGENLPSWLEIVGDNDNEKWTIRQKQGAERVANKQTSYKIYISDSGAPTETIMVPLVVGEVVPKLEAEGTGTTLGDSFNPPLTKGIYSIAKFSDVCTISGGIPPYTLSTDGGLENTGLSFYQGQGAEQDPNRFYIAGTLTTDGEVGGEFTIRDGMGQSIVIEMDEVQPKELLRFTLTNSLAGENFVVGQELNNLQIISVEAGSGNYTCKFKGQENVKIIPGNEDYPAGITFYSDGHISGTFSTPNLKPAIFSSEFSVIDNETGVEVSYSDGSPKHTWTGPRVYAKPVSTGMITVPKMVEGSPYSSPALFSSGIGATAHPDLIYKLFLNNSEIESDALTESTGLIWHPESASFTTSASGILAFEGNVGGTVKVKAIIGNLESENSLKFNGITEALMWIRTKSGENDKRFGTLDLEESVRQKDQEEDYTITDLRNFEFGEYTYKINNPDEQLTASLLNAPILYESSSPESGGWALEGYELKYTYPEALPDTNTGIVTVEFSDDNGARIYLNLKWNGVIEPLVISRYPTAIPEHNLINGSTINLSDSTYDLTISGGSSANYRVSLIERNGMEESVVIPYGVPGNNLITNDNRYGSAAERAAVNVGNTSYPKRTNACFKVWDYKTDPEAKSPVYSGAVTIGKITGGLPKYPTGEEKLMLAGGEIAETSTQSWSLSDYFYGSSSFSLSAVGANYEAWVADGGSVEFTIANNTLTAAIRYPMTSKEATTFDLRIVSTESSIVGQSIIIEDAMDVGEVITSEIKTYGASWDGSSNTQWTRTDAAENFGSCVPYISGASGEECYSPFDNIMPWAGMRIVEDSTGSLVAIPKFYYKLTKDAATNGLQVAISMEQKPQFMCSPAHMDRGDGQGERDTIYVGRYHCAASTYKSMTGAVPAASLTKEAFRNGINGFGEEYHIADFATRFTIWLLYIVEFANWNSQTMIGYGCGNGSSKTAMGYTDNMPYHTGTTQSTRTAYGYGTQYRHIEGLWDNVGDWLEGYLNRSNGNRYDLRITVDPQAFDNPDKAAWATLGTPDYSSQTFPGLFDLSGNAPFACFYPVKGGGSESTYSCDVWYPGAAPDSAVGGHYGNSLMRGIMGIWFTQASAVVGARIMKLPNNTQSE